MFRAADYVAELLGQTPPPRPNVGPAAMVTINLPEISNYEKQLDAINYPQKAIESLLNMPIHLHEIPSVSYCL